MSKIMYGHVNKRNYPKIHILKMIRSLLHSLDFHFPDVTHVSFHVFLSTHTQTWTCTCEDSCWRLCLENWCNTALLAL